jgi:hypothetical protein
MTGYDAHLFLWMKWVCNRHDPHRELELGSTWGLPLYKDDKFARCFERFDSGGYELRFVVGDELIRSAMCKSGAEVRQITDQWQAAMIAEGWRREIL